MSNNKKILLEMILEELNDAIFEKFEDNSEINLSLSTNGYAANLSFRCDLLDNENYSLYDDEKEDFEHDGKNLNEMLTGREKALIELSKKFENIRKSSEVVLEHIYSELKKKTKIFQYPSIKVYEDKFKMDPGPNYKIYCGNPSGIETDLNKPNEFDNKRFE